MMRSLLLLALVLAVPSMSCTNAEPPADALAESIESIEIEANGMTFEALAAGPADGELVILLHGFPQTAYSYRRQIPALAAAGYRVVAPNQRGYSPGARPAGVEHYVTAELAGDVAAIADALEAQTFHLVGHDWGGAVAWVTATRFPHRIRTLSVLSTPHFGTFNFGDTESEQAKKSSYMAEWGAPGAEEAFLADDATMLRGIYDPAVFTPEEVEVYVTALGTPQALRGALNWYSALLRGSQPPPDASKEQGPGGVTERGAPQSSNDGGSTRGVPPAGPPKIRTPTLYVWGTEDFSFARESAEATANFVEGPYRFEELEGMGHWLAEQAGERVTELILEQVGGGVANR